MSNNTTETSLPYYYPIANEVEIFEHAQKNNLPLLLKGPTGCGKSRFVEYMAAKLGQALITVACHEETSAIDLLGRYLVKGTETVWQDGPLTRAVRQGAFIYLDEIAEARPDVIVAIHSLTDHRRMLFLDRHDEDIPAKAGFMLIASYNPSYQRGWKELKPSTRQRFVSYSFNYPSSEREVEILVGETGVDLALAKKLVSLAAKLRNLHELGISEAASTRLLVDAAKLVRSGLAPRAACEVAIAEPLSDDKDIVSALKDVIYLIF